ncbi:MAG: tetratricopeptide repeat protein [Candidatus Gastranaerophilales bacterium]|nr:tetratricopeptide repeat protein [Candidatus Gastranaerophilales bacterium]
MKKLKKIFESTLARVISAVLIIGFGLSVFFFFDFYERQFDKMQGFYWVHKGDKALKKQDLHNAINFYEKGIKLHPKHYRAMYNLANIYVVYEDYYKALENYEKALKVKPDYEVARIDYALILSETFKTDEAIKQYKKVIANKPKFIKIPFLVDNKKSYIHNTGVAYYNMGRAYRTKSLLAGLNRTTSRQYLEKASESYEEAVEILKSYNSNYNLGLIHQLLKNKNQAGFYYCKAMEKEPLNYEAHFNLAVLLNDMKDYTGAASEFKKAGMLLDSTGDNYKTRYIYDILSEVNQKIAINNDSDYFKKLREEEDKKSVAKLKAGKIVFDYEDDDNDEFMKSFSTCAGREIFVGE